MLRNKRQKNNIKQKKQKKQKTRGHMLRKHKKTRTT